MAARIKLPSNLTLVYRRTPLFEQIHRKISTTSVCSGASWTVQSQSKREKVLYQAPKHVQPGKKQKKDEVQNIVIPEKINRSSTSILEALASTVRNDVNQPRYMSIDDPHLYATTDRAKKSLMASYESGCRTAEHMLSLYPDYFTQIWEDPLPDAWKDGSSYTHTEPSEQALLERIDKRKVTEAMNLYRTLKSDGMELSQASQERLLELLLVFNCKDPQPERDVETFINAPDYHMFSPFPPNTWLAANAAEEVFNALPEQTATAHCHMIRGMAANFNKEGAMTMYSTMKAKHMPVDLETYNAILRLASLDTESMDDVKIFIETILRDMKTSNVSPDEQTFVAAMINCRRLSRWTGSKKFVLSLMSEMKACGIEPGLSTYVEILHIFYYFKDKTSKSPEMFEQVLNNLEGKEFDCKTENDVQFFRAAIGMIAAHFPDPKLALNVHKLLQHGKNRNLLTNRQSQYGYYNDLFSVLVPLEPIDSVMELYHQLVPYVFFPPSRIYKALLESIELHESYHHVTDIYADLQWTSMFKDFDFLSCFTQSLANKKQEPKLQADFSAIAKSLMEAWASKQHLTESLPVNGVIIGHLMAVHLNNDDLKTAWNLFEIYRNSRRMRGADPSESSLAQLADHAISAQDYHSTKEVLNVMNILDYDTSPLVEKCLQTLTLSEAERAHLEGFTSSSSSSDSSDSD